MVDPPARPDSLRERGKRRRREAVLSAVRDILRDGDAADLTAERVAARAEVSVATVYNLVGPRDRWWAALVAEVVQEVSGRTAAAGPGEDPVAWSEALVTAWVTVLQSDPDVNRKVVLALWSSGAELPDTGPRPVDPFVDAVARAVEAGVVRSDVAVEVLGMHVLVAAVGAMQLWAVGALSIRQLELHALASVHATLALAATPAHRESLHERWELVTAELLACVRPARHGKPEVG